MTDDPSLILLVRAAIAASATSAADSGMSSVWCSPIPKKSTPACSAKHALLDDVPDRLRVRDPVPIVVVGRVAVRVQPEHQRKPARPCF